MTTKALSVNNEIEKIVNTRGFQYVVNELDRWVSNKIELIRAYSPEEKNEIQTLRVVSVKLRDVIERYNQPT